MDEKDIAVISDAALQINSLCDITRTYSDSFDTDEMVRINLMIEKIQEQTCRITTLLQNNNLIP